MTQKRQTSRNYSPNTIHFADPTLSPQRHGLFHHNDRMGPVQETGTKRLHRNNADSEHRRCEKALPSRGFQGREFPSSRPGELTLLPLLLLLSLDGNITLPPVQFILFQQFPQAPVRSVDKSTIMFLRKPISVKFTYHKTPRPP